MLQDARRPINYLRWQWLLVTACYAAGLLLGYRLLAHAWGAAPAGQWLVLAATTMAVQLAILWRSLPENRSPTASAIFPFLGYANILTLARGLLVCMLAGFLFAPSPTGALAWAPALLYMCERGIDLADGYVARVTRSVTRLGAILDMEFDGLGVLVTVTLAIEYGKLPIWYFVLGVARPLFVLGMWLRQRQGLPVYDLPPSDYRRVIAGGQFAFLCLVLWPAISPEVTRTAAYLFAVPLVLSFVRDWLVVSGVIDPAAASYYRRRRWAKRLVEGWLPLGARLFAALTMLLILAREFPGFPHWAPVLALLPGSGAASVLGAVALSGLAAAALVLAGVASRVAALLLFALASLDIVAAGLRWQDNVLLLACAVFILHVGSGRFSLWKPEERLLRPHSSHPGPVES